MSAPDQSATVRRIHDQNPTLLQVNTKESVLRFMMLLGPALLNESAEWGYLTKMEAEKHLTMPDGTFVGIDSIIWRPTQEVFDVLTNAVEAGSSRPTWQVVPRRSHSVWYSISDALQGEGEVPVNNSGLEARVAELEKKLQALSRISLKAVNGRFVCAENRGDLPLIANRDGIGGWEEFELIPRG